MKYRDEDGYFQELYFKASDTLPVGTEVDYDGETAPAGWEEIDEPKDTYSTDEVKTNKVWIDGKPIYRKVITNTTPSSSSVTKNIGTISNLDSLVSINGHIISQDYGKIPTPQNFDTNNNNKLWIDQNNNVSVEINNTAYRNKDIIAIVEYTKTTD